MPFISYTTAKARSPYQTRVVRQSILWLNGVNRHNDVDDECTPDFRCCVSTIPETPFEERQNYVRRYLARLETEDEESV